jgi:2-methylaconitate cis-trans-isomerase PrpF
MTNRGIPAVLARGGASRGLIVLKEDLRHIPSEHWESLFALWVGSPDPSGRQIDGVGGGNPSTSKVVVLGDSEIPGRDFDYSFFQIDPITGRADRRGTCGNLTAACGLVAVSNGLVPVSAPSTVVRLKCTNTSKDIDVEVPLAVVPTSTGASRSRYAAKPASITSSFLEPAGATTGRLFPTGNSTQELELDHCRLSVTLIDAVNPVVLVDGRSIGADVHRSPTELESDPALMRRLEQVRAWAAVACGFATSVQSVPEESSFYPFIGMTFPPQNHHVSGGATIGTDDVDVVVRMLSGPTVHRALPLSAGLATAAATLLGQPGRADHRPIPVRLGHPSGVLTVDVTPGEETTAAVRQISVPSSARVIMRGYLEVN